jgi:AbrB family looped-hinge helix DNA binding protein
MSWVNKFKFFATVSDRGQIFIPKALQNYFRINSRDKVAFEVENDGKVVFRKQKGGDQ